MWLLQEALTGIISSITMHKVTYTVTDFPSHTAPVSASQFLTGHIKDLTPCLFG